LDGIDTSALHLCKTMKKSTSKLTIRKSCVNTVKVM
jgi:hypothetical protein